MTADLPPPVLEQPAPQQVTYGTVSGRAPMGTVRLVVQAGGLRRDLPLRGRAFTVRLDLLPGETAVRVVAVDRTGRRAETRVAPVFALPRAAAPAVRGASNDPWLAAALQRELRRFGPYTGVYVQCLSTGRGAAWNARATFPAASTLKLAIAAAVLARAPETPRRGTTLDRWLRAMITVSDDRVANTVLTWLGGSTSAGGWRVNELMRSLGLVDSEMYGGYLVERRSAATIPLDARSQPAWGSGKRTTAFDLARLVRAVWLASADRGPFPRAAPGFTRADARYLLYLLAHVRDLPKLDAAVGAIAGVAVLHKAGWIDRARHDAGLVVSRGGVFVAAVMTYRPAGAGAASDRLAGRVAAIALRRCR